MSEPTSSQIKILNPSADAVPSNTTLTMLNLIRFHPQAIYPSGTETISGREVYFKRYLPQFAVLAAKVGVKYTTIYLGEAHSSMLLGVNSGEGEKWDIASLIRFERYEDVRKVTETEEYKITALPHRLAAIHSHHLVSTTEIVS
ncbi:unnamed protein product [Discula destructiva]